MKSISTFWNENKQFVRTMRDLHSFMQQVEATPINYDVGTLLRIQTILTKAGIDTLNDIGRAFIAENSLNQEAALLVSDLLGRHQAMWTQYLSKAFSTARDNMDPVDDRGRRRKSIVQRIRDFVFELFQSKEDFGQLVSKGKVFSIKYMIDGTQTVMTDVKISYFTKALNRRVWTYDDRKISPFELLNLIRGGTYDPRLDAENNRSKMETVNLSEPLLMWKFTTDLSKISLGYHYVLGAYARGRKIVKVNVAQGGVPVEAVTVVPPTWEKMKPALLGVARTRRVERKDGKVQRRLFTIRLVPYVKLLTQTVPSTFLREAALIKNAQAARSTRTPPEKRLVRVTNPGKVNDSSPVCMAVQGRVLTHEAFVFVQKYLQSPLFHPNCRHGVDSNFSDNVDTYDNRYGKIMGLNDVKRLVGKKINGKTIRQAKRPNSHILLP